MLQVVVLSQATLLKLYTTMEVARLPPTLAIRIYSGVGGHAGERAVCCQLPGGQLISEGPGPGHCQPTLGR